MNSAAACDTRHQRKETSWRVGWGQLSSQNSHPLTLCHATAVDIERKTGDNVEQIKDTQRDKVMTFSYDMSMDTGYDKPVYKGTGNGLGGDGLDPEYDVIVIGTGNGLGGDGL